MTTPYQSPVALPDEYFRLIGIIAAHWERVEYLLEWTVAEAANLKHHRVGLLTTNIGFRSKCDIVLSYARALEPTAPSEWKAIKAGIKKITDAYILRNTYIHAKWIPPGRGHKQVMRSVVRTSGGKANIANEITTIEEMAKAAHDIDTAGADFMALMQSYGLLKSKQRTSRKKQPSR